MGCIAAFLLEERLEAAWLPPKNVGKLPKVHRQWVHLVVKVVIRKFFPSGIKIFVTGCSIIHASGDGVVPIRRYVIDIFQQRTSNPR